jgi:preprotein translocase SecE subunit
VSEAVDTLDKGKKEGIGEFVRKTREELDKTSFPSSNDVKNTTIIVIVNVIFFAIYLFLIDKGWTYLLDGLTWLVNRIAGL